MSSSVASAEGSVSQGEMAAADEETALSRVAFAPVFGSAASSRVSTPCTRSGVKTASVTGGGATAGGPTGGSAEPGAEATISPRVSVAGDVGAASEGTGAGSSEPPTGEIGGSTASTIGRTGSVTVSMTDPVVPVVETVTDPVTPVVEPVTDPVVPVVETVTDPLVPVVELSLIHI